MHSMCNSMKRSVRSSQTISVSWQMSTADLWCAAVLPGNELPSAAEQTAPIPTCTTRVRTQTPVLAQTLRPHRARRILQDLTKALAASENQKMVLLSEAQALRRAERDACVYADIAKDKVHIARNESTTAWSELAALRELHAWRESKAAAQVQELQENLDAASAERDAAAQERSAAVERMSSALLPG